MSKAAEMLLFLFNALYIVVADMNLRSDQQSPVMLLTVQNSGVAR